MPNKTLSLLRSLFPSWRFFAEVTEVPVLHYRVGNAAGEFGPWLPGLKAPARKWYTIFFNPDGNLFMALNSHLQLFEDELEHGSADPNNSVSFHLTEAIVRRRMRDEHQESPGTQFQFRLGRVFQGSSHDECAELFTSPVLTV